MSRANQLAPFLSRLEQLLDRDPAVSLPQNADARYGFIDFFLSPIHFDFAHIQFLTGLILADAGRTEPQP